MKNTVISVMLLLCSFSAVDAQWQKMPGPFHYFVGGIARFGQNLYASSRQAMYSRPLNANTWQPVAAIPDNFNPGGFFQMDNTLFTYSVQGMYRSEDGTTWQDVSVHDSAFAHYFFQDNQLFAWQRFENPGFYRSVDKGETWNKLIDGNYSRVRFWGEINGSIYLWVWNLSGPRNLFRSTDDGATWDSLGGLPLSGTVFPEQAIRVGDTIFMSGYQPELGIYRSPDGGQTWDFSITNLSSGIFYNRGNTLFLRTQGQSEPHYYRSVDQAQNWTPMAEGLNGYSDVLVTENAIYLVAEFNQLYRSTNDGATWAPVNFNPENDFRPTYIWQSGNRVALYGEGGIYISTDDGLNWSLSRDGLLPYELTVAKLMKQGNWLFGSTNAGLLRSPDQGQTWELSQNGLPQLPATFTTQPMASTSSTVLLTTAFGAFLSENNGDSWQPFAIDGQWTPAMVAAKGDSLFAYVPSFSLFLSVDAGVSWEIISTLPSTGTYGYLFVRESVMIFGGSSKYAVSKDGGGTWTTHVFDGLPPGFSALNMTEHAGRYYVNGFTGNSSYIGISEDVTGSWTPSVFDDDGPAGPAGAVYELFVTDDLLVVLPYPGGLHISKDNGTSWMLEPVSGTGPTDVIALKADDQYLYAGTNFYGVWRLPLTKIIVNTTDAVVAGGLSARLYPNPVNGLARLEYELPEVSEIFISLVDQTGKTVANLSAGKRQRGTVRDDLLFPHGLPSGHYRLNIVTTSGSASIPVVLK